MKKYIEFDENKKLDIVLLGRITVDLNPTDYFKPLSESTTFRKYVGGSTCNTSIGLARLGKKCGFIGRISNDQFGDYTKGYLDKEGIDTSHMVRCTDGSKTGLTFTEILSETESSILMYRDDNTADLKLEPDDIDPEYIASAKCLLVSGTALAASPSREAVLKAVAVAKMNKIPFIFDVDYRPYNWESMDAVAIYYSAVARDADVIIGSREEFDLTEKYLGLDGSDQASAKYWTGCGAKIVIIKHGKEGSTAYTNDGESYKIKPFPVKALKSTGGGDGYGSSFVNGLLEGWDIMSCLEHGSASASMMVHSHSCSEELPTLEELEAFIKAEKEEYGEMIARG